MKIRHLTTMSTQENDTKQAQLREEACQAWLNSSTIQFPLSLESPIHNVNSNIDSSHGGHENNDI